VEHVEIVPGITKLAPLDFIDYPITHSLLMACVWGILMGGVFWLIHKNSRIAIVIALCVVSHWVLDLLMHRPDLPLYPGDSPKLGFGLWNSLPGSLLVEGALFLAGVVLYLRTTTPKNKTGIYSFWALIAFLVVIHVGNLFGPPPPSVSAIAWAGQLQWLFVIWAYWVDRNRTPRLQPT
jgi:membrane-bound metal-dependent hydrolase YbcI (DUF457 family)